MNSSSGPTRRKGEPWGTKGQEITTVSPVVASKQTSRYLDHARHKLSELEREIYWLDIEAKSLQRQVRDADASVAIMEKSKLEGEQALQKITDVTKVISQVCAAVVFGHTSDLHQSVSSSLQALSGLDERLEKYKFLNHLAICSAVIDSPTSSEDISSYLQCYGNSICSILGRAVGHVGIVSAVNNSQSEGSIRVYFTLYQSDTECLQRNIKAHPSDRVHNSDEGSQLFLRVTRSVIVDVPPYVSVDTHSVHQYQIPPSFPDPTVRAAGNDSRPNNRITDSTGGEVPEESHAHVLSPTEDTQLDRKTSKSTVTWGRRAAVMF